MALFARTEAEAQLFMDLRPCVCGETRFAREGSVVGVEDEPVKRYTGACAGCGAERLFEFRMSGDVPPADGVRFGGPEPSQLLDPGEWLLVADEHAGHVPERVALDDDALAHLAVVIAAHDEVLKFIPPNRIWPPREAFRTPAGREMRDRDVERFRVTRLKSARGRHARVLADPATGTDPLDTGTWKWDRGCVYWCFTLRTGSSRSAAMADYASRLPGLLPGFAVPAVASWTTRSAGEDAVVLDRGTAIGRGTVAAVFRDLPDVYVFDLELDLVLTAPDGRTEVPIVDGAQLTLELGDKELTLELSLNTDIYARRTWGDTSLNDTLAGLNAPRLAASLARIRTELHARFQEIDTNELRYRRQVTEHGFHQALTDAGWPEVLAALDAGRAVHFNNRPDDLQEFVLWEEDIVVRRETGGGFVFGRDAICHDGAGMSTGRRYETLDEATARHRITQMLHGRFLVELQ